MAFLSRISLSTRGHHNCWRRKDGKSRGITLKIVYTKGIIFVIALKIQQKMPNILLSCNLIGPLRLKY